MLSIAVNIHNGLPLGTLPFGLNVKLKCFCSAQGRHSDPAHLLKSGEEKKLTHLLLNVGQATRHFARFMAFFFTCSLPLPLCSVRELASRPQ